MRLNLSILATLFRTELRMVLRDRRIIVAAILLPLLILPLMFFGSNWSMKQRERKVQSMAGSYAVTGSRAAEVRELLSRAHERALAKGQTNGLFEEITVTNAVAALNAGEIQVIVEGLNAQEAREKEAANKPPTASSKAAQKPDRSGDKVRRDEKHLPLVDSLVIRLTGRNDRDDSTGTIARLRTALEETRLAARRELLKAANFPVPLEELGTIKQVDLASQGQVAGLALGRMMTLLLLLFVLTGGTVVATDLLAGEKERGTLETLLTTGAGRLEIVLAKHLTVLTVGMLIAFIQSANLLVYIGFKLVPVPGSLAAAVSPWTAALLLALFLPVAALAASVLLLVSGKARTYKEAQLLFFPVFLIGLAPALAPLMPGLTLKSAIALAPVAGIAVAIKEILIGHFDWAMITVTWFATALPAVWLTRISVRFLSAEHLITAADPDVAQLGGGPAMFQQHVWRWFAVMWALLLMLGNYLEKADLRLQLFVNLVGIFLGASTLMLRFYRLNPREALALRLPRPAVWLGTLIAVPGGIISAVGLFQLASLVFPVPSRLLEAFNQSVLPDTIPFWQLLFFLSLMPGVLEEIAFRGMLLHGLRNRMHPALLALVVGMVFGLFHGTLFRFAPTACLGVMLAAVVLLTGSILPAMLWHCLNNALGVLAAHHEIPLTEFDAAGYLTGAGMLVLGFWIIWRHRTAYPELRLRRSERYGGQRKT